MSGLIFRTLRPSDAEAVAALHTASWRTAYRGILDDTYLDAFVAADRAQVWHTRLDTPRDDAFGVAAVRDAILVGFVYVTGGADAQWGALIDNLHVAPGERSGGIGPKLLEAAARGITQRGWGPRVHLFVFEANAGARRFYQRMGGLEVEHLIKPAPDGQQLPEWRVAWSDVSVLQSPAHPSC